MTPLEAAARGWWVFPVRDRRPITAHGHKDATLDPATIVDWQDQFPGCSWGLDLERSGLVVLDVDVKNGKPGMASLEALMPELPETLCAETPSGGLHLYYERPAGWVPRRVIGWRPGLDLLSKGVLFLYPNDGAQIVRAPEILGSPERPQERPEGGGGTPATPEVRKAAERWLRAHGGAVEGEGGNAHTVQAVTRLLWDFDMTPEEAWPLLEEWNRGCEPPWEEDELAYKVEHLHEGESRRGVARMALAAKPRREPMVFGRLVDAVPEIRADSRLPVIRTPWPQLDEAMGGGLPVGTVTVVAAGTGAGKTSFAAQLGAHHAAGGPVVYYMGELTRAKLAARVVAQRRRTSWMEVLRGQVPDQESTRILEPLDFRVVERCDEPVDAIEAALDAVAEASGVVMLVVDYAQLLADSDDPRASVTKVSHYLLKLTNERKLVTVILSQTSRLTASMLRADGEVRAENFVGAGAESSALEQDADNVLVLRLTGDEGDAEVLVSKARLRGPGKVGMRFHGSSGRWEEIDLAAAKVEKLEARLELVRVTLRRLNSAGIYPSKNMLREECGVRSKGDLWKTIIEALGAELEIIIRDPVHHTSLKNPGLLLGGSPKAKRGTGGRQ